jgi:hypothetical protein
VLRCLVVTGVLGNFSKELLSMAITGFVYRFVFFWQIILLRSELGSKVNSLSKKGFQDA